MRRLKRPPRLATLCVHGDVATRVGDNAQRIGFLKQLTTELRRLSDWHPVDAIILPGGFFRMSRAFGATTFAQRRRLVSTEQFTGPIRRSLRSLGTQSPGIRLVAGVLARPCDVTERTEQCSLVFDQGGLVAAARKIFPTASDTRGERLLSPFQDDYGSPHRFFSLANGSVAVAAACYDLFGVADRAQPGTRRAAIRRLLTPEGPIKLGDACFLALRKACLATWARQLEEQDPDVAVATIHRFAYPGADGYWQRHGIARASAALDGALVVGAAHFIRKLPEGFASSLAAAGVGLEHLFAGVGRPACRLAPIRQHVLHGPCGPTAVLRLFMAPANLVIGGRRTA